MIRIVPPVWAAAAVAVQLVSPPGRRTTRGSLIAAAPFALGALAVQQAAVLSFRRARTTLSPEHPERSTEIVTDGVYAVSRNPIYLAFAIGLVGIAIARRSWAALLPAAGFVAIIDRTQIPAEEAALDRTFGRRFRRYRDLAPRWIGIPRH